MSSNIEIARGFRAYAEFLEQHPEIPGKPVVDLYPGSKTETARHIWTLLSSPVAKIEPEHDLSSISQRFAGITVTFNFNRSTLATPRIMEDGSIVWDMRPEFQPISAEVANA